MTKARMNAELQSRASTRASRRDESTFLADPEYRDIRAQLSALPRNRSERSDEQQAQVRALLARKYAREDALAAR